MNIVDRKLINIFKSFIQKIFVPQLPKLQASCQQEWNKFSSMISTQQINLNQLQLYIETLPNFGSNTTMNNNLNNFNNLINKQNLDRQQVKSPFLNKIRKDSVSNEQNNNGGFSLTRTFGGERARMMFPLKDFDQSPSQQSSDRQNNNFSKDFSKDKQENSLYLSTDQINPILERIFKTFTDNQLKIQKPGIQMSYQTRTY